MEFMNLMPGWAQLVFIGGALFIGVSLTVVLCALSEWAKEQLERLAYYIRRKHRFNKPPLAKCYCRDCEEWHPSENDPTEGKCWGHAGWVTADNWFCWSANPRERERK